MRELELDPHPVLRALRTSQKNATSIIYISRSQGAQLHVLYYIVFICSCFIVVKLNYHLIMTCNLPPHYKNGTAENCLTSLKIENKKLSILLLSVFFFFYSI